MAPTRPCDRAFVPVGASNRCKCSYLYQGKKYPVQIKKTDLEYMCGCFVVVKELYVMRE
jgi:hypothetical protein